MFNYKLDTQYSKMLGKLLLYLTKNKTNLNQYTLVRPYHLLSKLAVKYSWDVYIRVHCAIQPSGNSLNGAFKVKGWTKNSGLTKIKNAFASNNYDAIIIDPVHLALNNYQSLSTFSKVTLFTYKFKLMASTNGHYIQLFWNRSYTPSIHDTIDCFIGSILVLKSIVDYNSHINSKRKNRTTKNSQNAITKQAKRIKNGAYSWNNVFGD